MGEAQDANVLHIAMLMKENECGFIPVVENDKLIGVVTDRDIVLRCIAQDKTPVMAQAKDIMTPTVLYCYDHHSAENVAMNMAENQVRRMPVVNQDKRLVGVVSLGDLAQIGDKVLSR